MSTLTDKQIAELHRVVSDVQQHFQVGIRCIEDFCIHYDEETRPGRGHAIRFNYIDGDHAVTGSMDVYGYANFAVAHVDFIHDDGNEECDCTPCIEANA